MRISLILLALISLTFCGGYAFAQGSYVNGSFEDSAAPGDGLGGILNWTDENTTVSVDNTVFGPPGNTANDGAHYISASNGGGASQVDVSQYVTGLQVGSDYRADFVAYGGPTGINAGARWIAGNTTGGGQQRGAGADMGSISLPVQAGWTAFGGTPVAASQADYTLYVYAEDASGWTCGAGEHMDAAVGGSLTEIVPVNDWALY